MTTNKLLCFLSQRLSYQSSVVFIEEIGKVLSKDGFEITWCNLDALEDNFDILENYTKQNFDAVIDINSVLPLTCEETEDGRKFPFLDLFSAPFINIIVDHPMHVHYALQVPLKNYYVVCLDEDHKAYIKEQYPHIKDVYVMSMGGILAKESIPYEKRSHTLLFPATYTPLSYLKDQMESVSETYPLIAEKICHYYIEESSPRTIDTYFFQEALSDEEMKAFKLYRGRYVDRYVREWYRQNILMALLSEGIHVDVVGFRWEMLPEKYKNNLTIYPPCNYRETIEMIADSKMVLNVQPLFLDGMHDRIENAIANGAVCLTDGCRQAAKYQKKYGTVEKTGIFVYDKNQPKKLASALQNQEVNVMESALSGKECYKNNAVYEEKVHGFSDFVRKIITNNSQYNC